MACVDAAEDSTGLYAALQQRRSQLAERRTGIVDERRLLASLTEAWPASELAQSKLWQHWYNEEGDAAREKIERAEELSEEDNGAALIELIQAYPQWAEPVNGLATLRYIRGDFEESITLCHRVLKIKPWHFGAQSGLVMCHQNLGNMEESDKCRENLLPISESAGDLREEWVKRMLPIIDERIDELGDVL